MLGNPGYPYDAVERVWPVSYTHLVYLIQGFFTHSLHGFVDTEGSDAVRSVKGNILWGQTYDLSLIHI